MSITFYRKEGGRTYGIDVQDDVSQEDELQEPVLEQEKKEEEEDVWK